jgi:hypothetical protein
MISFAWCSRYVSLASIWSQCGPHAATFHAQFFKQKGCVEVYLSHEVRAGNISLATAQKTSTSGPIYESVSAAAGALGTLTREHRVPISAWPNPEVKPFMRK